MSEKKHQNWNRYIYSDNLRNNVTLEDALLLQKQNDDFYKLLGKDMLANEYFVKNFIIRSGINDTLFLYNINNKFSNSEDLFNLILLNSYKNRMYGLIIIGKELSNDTDFIKRNITRINPRSIPHYNIDKNLYEGILLTDFPNSGIGIDLKMLTGTGIAERNEKEVIDALLFNRFFSINSLNIYTLEERRDILDRFSSLALPNTAYTLTSYSPILYKKCIYTGNYNENNCLIELINYLEALDRDEDVNDYNSDEEYLPLFIRAQEYIGYGDFIDPIEPYEIYSAESADVKMSVFIKQYFINRYVLSREKLREFIGNYYY